MEVGDMEIIERISRVLAGQYFSRNAVEAAGDDSVSVLVEQNWADFQEDAVAVLKTLRVLPDTIQNEPETTVWAHIIKTALGPFHAA